MRIARPAARGVAALLACLSLAAPSTLSPAYAGTRTLHDNSDYDVPTRDIDMAKLKVTYDGKGVRATVTMKDLRRTDRIRIFVAFLTRPTDDIDAPEYGNLVEFRLDEHRRQKVVNWVVNPDYDDYSKQKCRGIKVKADYDKERLTYKVPNRCVRFDFARAYVDSYASARKYKPQHWDEGSPANSTGDWFDTTYDLVTPR
jgi:hypothetical protein